MKPDDFHDRAGSFWSSVPEQLRRLPFLAVLIIGALVVFRLYMVPGDFGEYGHYRASALEDAAALEIKYAGQQVCVDCHDDVVETKAGGYHKSLSCEICHGPAAVHVAEEGDAELRAPRERGKCPLCHEYLPSRPTGFPQIISASHNPVKSCISCHDAHNPTVPAAPEECRACHAAIANTKSLSAHAYVQCVRCHETSEEHKINPRRYPPSRPTDREFCGGCHDSKGPGDEDIKKIDMGTHGEKYVCWQCHYPHLPEVN